MAAAAATKTTSGHLATLVKYVAAAYLVREHIAEFTICVGPSMMPTFDPSGEVALVERMFMATTLRNRPIQKGDIVIAKSVQNAKQSVCKRVVGLEGDVVTYRDVTRVRYDVDGYGRYDPNGKGSVRQVTVPKGHIFIQGDNESNSTDSRQYGPVPYATLQGRVVAKVWPKMGWVT
jgi:signal peptidase I